MGNRLWKCDNGTFDVVDDYGVVHQNVPEHTLAAAPELLEAVQMLCALLHVRSGPPPTQISFNYAEIRPLIAKARAVIAKATEVSASNPQVEVSGMEARKIKCECTDRGCNVHKGQFCKNVGVTTTLYRVDTLDITGTEFCEPCVEDAIESGLFTSEGTNFNEDDQDR